MQEARQEIAAELPDLIRTDQMRKSAAEEDTFSGALRRAIHKHDLSLTQIADQCGIGVEDLDEFLTGERTLRSDMIDRIAALLGCTLCQKESPNGQRTPAASTRD